MGRKTTKTGLDILAGAISQLASQGYAVDGIVLNGRDAFNLRTLKTADNAYVWSDPSLQGTAVSNVWSVPVVISPSIAAGVFLVGAFAQATLVFDRETLGIEVSYENEDDFVRNMATLRGELRAGLAIPVPGGLLTGTLPSPTTAEVRSTAP
jgi:HK97 family phage major capsid protein